MTGGDNLNCVSQSGLATTVGVIWRQTHAQYSKLMSSLNLKGYALKLGSWNGAVDPNMYIF